MSIARFNFNGIQTIIQCTKTQKMKDICQNFASKVQINFNNLIFLYGGKIIDLELTFEKQANAIDINNNEINVLVYEYEKCDEIKLNELEKNSKITNENIRDIMKEDLKKKGKDLLVKHLDGRTYKEEKVDEWMKNILDEYENYFKQKYPSYYSFMFLDICSKDTYFYIDYHYICVSSKETTFSCQFITDALYSCINLFFFKSFNSISNFSLEPKIISFGNKLLYEIFDERKYDNKMSDYCARFNKEFQSFFCSLDKRRRVLNLTFAFQKPLKNFSYNYRAICPYHLSKIIQTFLTVDTEIYHFAFIFSNDNKN